MNGVATGKFGLMTPHGRDIVFGTNGTERFRISSGKTGIAFNSDTAQANHLDDYEEGSFTATLANTGTSPTPTGAGYYTKIGGVVYVSMYFAGITINNAGNTQIQGLPFSASVPNGAYSICHYSHGTIIASGSGGYFSGTSIDLIGENSTGYSNWNVGNTKYGMWSGFYFTTQ